jgi:hypothetical protein
VLIFIAILLTVIPAVAILYPFLRRSRQAADYRAQSPAHDELSLRWEAAIAGLKNAELEYAIGALSEDDHRELREEYMTNAALVMKEMDLEDQQEADIIAGIEQQVRDVRERVLGAEDGADPQAVPVDQATGD